MGTEYKSDNSLRDYIVGNATGYSYNVWSGVGAGHHRPFQPTPPPKPPKKPEAPKVVVTAGAIPRLTQGGDLTAVSTDTDDFASRFATAMYGQLERLGSKIAPYLWVVALAGALAGILAAYRLGLSGLPSPWVNLALGAVSGGVAALLSVAALGVLAAVSIFVVHCTLVATIFALRIAMGLAVVMVALYVVSFFYPDLAQFLSKW